MTKRLLTLGPLEVRDHGDTMHLRPAQRRVLALLASSYGRGDTDTLIDRFWSADPPTSARTALQVHIHGIRQIAPDLIQTENGSYVLDTSTYRHDVGDFARRAAQARRAGQLGDWSDALVGANTALSLWRAEPFPEVRDDPIAVTEIARLGEIRSSLLDIWIKALLATNQHEQSLPHIRSAVAEFPLWETMRSHLMLALYRSGRQAEALAVYQQYRRLIGEELGIEPAPDLRDLEERILLHDPTLGTPVVGATPHNLSQPQTSFVGRREEIEQINHFLDQARLVSITGGPGVGKTRTAMEVARSRLDHHTDGIWWVDLSGVASGNAVAARIATAAGLTESSPDLFALGRHLSATGTLFVLDNCEHVLNDAERFSAGLVHDEGSARVLATTRRPFGMEEEHRFPLQPLTNDVTSAVQLLADRVRSVDPAFRLDEKNRAQLADLSSRLGGVPLALEVAARLVPTLGPQEAVRLLGDADSGEALQQALDWSFDLLADIDRELLVSLSIFSAPFTLRRAHDVAADEDPELSVAGSISRLVEASLLSSAAYPDEAVRYRMAAPVADYARSRVNDVRRSQLGRSHSRSFAMSAGLIHDEMERPDQSRATQETDVEIDDYRSAMEYASATGDWETVVTIASGLERYWYARFLGWEGLTWLDRAMTETLEPGTRSRALTAAGFLTWGVHDYAASDRYYRQALDLAENAGDQDGRADALYGLGRMHYKLRRVDGAAMLEEAAAIYRTLPAHGLELGQCLMFLGIDQALTGNTADAVPTLSEADSLLEAAGHRRQVSKTQRWLAHACRLEDRFDQASAHAASAEELARQTFDMPALSGALIERAFLAAAAGDAARGASLLLEAIEPIPLHDEIDVCQVLIPAASVLAQAAQADLARQALAHVAEVYERSGWRALGEHEETRRIIDQVGDPTFVEAGTVARILEALNRLSTETQGPK